MCVRQSYGMNCKQSTIEMYFDRCFSLLFITIILCSLVVIESISTQNRREEKKQTDMAFQFDFYFVCVCEWAQYGWAYVWDNWRIFRFFLIVARKCSLYRFQSSFILSLLTARLVLHCWDFVCCQTEMMNALIVFVTKCGSECVFVLQCGITRPFIRMTSQIKSLPMQNEWTQTANTERTGNLLSMGASIEWRLIIQQ